MSKINQEASISVLTICILVKYFFHHKYGCMCGPRAAKK